jgi:hypothetical protein
MDFNFLQEWRSLRFPVACQYEANRYFALRVLLQDRQDRSLEEPEIFGDADGKGPAVCVGEIEEGPIGCFVDGGVEPWIPGCTIEGAAGRTGCEGVDERAGRRWRVRWRLR